VADKGRHDRQRPPLSIPVILGWADEHFRNFGDWPSVEPGALLCAPDESWWAIAQALDHGHRGLPGGSSLARLLAEYRGVRSRLAQPRLPQRQIVSWAESLHRATGRWPNNASGQVSQSHGTASLKHRADPSLRGCSAAPPSPVARTIPSSDLDPSDAPCLRPSSRRHNAPAHYQNEDVVGRTITKVITINGWTTLAGGGDVRF